jgi:hypothetical protein
LLWGVSIATSIFDTYRKQPTNSEQSWYAT